jgi:uncharacterized protein with FMN-binding domain
MRRALSAVALTIVALAALAAFKSTAPAGIKSARALTPATTVPPAAAPPATTPTTPAPATNPPAAAPPTTAAPSGATKTYDGDPVDNRYGTVQVRITVQGKQVTNVDLLQMPYSHSRSQYISEQAGPYLQQETLQAQSANIDVVSGATITSESYIQSLQSALDKAGI